MTTISTVTAPGHPAALKESGEGIFYGFLWILIYTFGLQFVGRRWHHEAARVMKRKYDFENERWIVTLMTTKGTADAEITKAAYTSIDEGGFFEIKVRSNRYDRDCLQIRVLRKAD